MYMEPNDPKETAEDTLLPDPELEADWQAAEFEAECEPCEGAEWQHAGFEGYPLEDDDV